MARKYSTLQAKMSPEHRARAKARAEKILREMPLQELRRARALSQKTVGELLGMTQPEVSKLEHRTDAYISTVRGYIEAMGGELEIIARFPDGAVKIVQFRDIDREDATEPGATLAAR
jgi:transcriptional regulator with XRE-family HTH domain